MGAGITNGAASAAGTTAQSIKTGDIGFGFTTALDTSGASVVAPRSDVVATGFDYTGGWPAASNGRVTFTKSLFDIFNSDTQILSGDRISASGDNSSSDNFITATVGIATLPQYLTPAASFNATVTFTLQAP